MCFPERIWRWRSHISVVSSAITMRWLKERNQLFNTLRIHLPFAISFSVNAQMTLRKRSTWMCCTSCSSWRKNSALNSPTLRPNFWNSVCKNKLIYWLQIRIKDVFMLYLFIMFTFYTKFVNQIYNGKYIINEIIFKEYYQNEIKLLLLTKM